VSRVLVVVSHPDDELIFGAAVLLDPTVEKRILVCSSDENNPVRKWCAHRKDALFEVCDRVGIRAADRRVLPFDSEFAKVNHRNGLRSDILSEISKNITSMSVGCDCVFTHNMFGEYGHLDHVITWQTVTQTTSLPVVTTDTLVKLDWTPFSGANDNVRASLGKVLCEKKIDADKYGELEEVYRRHRVWTWCMPMIASVKLVSHSEQASSVFN